MDEQKTELKTLEDMLNLSREQFTEMVEKQYKKDFQGSKTDEQIMEIRMTI
jgi:hypothetical protein